LGELDQQFDYVLFMGLFYHLRYPLYALDLVVKKVRQRLIFQTMLRGEPGDDNEVKPDYTFWDATPFQQPGFPRMYFIERSFAGDATNWWIPNRAAAEAMLRTAGLEIVAHPEEETWICAPRPAPEGFVHDRELAATL
ncbi:MAG TPA: TIGR04290 family methyltransferase, partial [Terriglobales bacterium]